MAKFLQRDINEMIEHFRKWEEREPALRKGDVPYVPSTALTTLQQIATDWVSKPNVHVARALKHCVEESRGQRFLRAFQELHAYLFLVYHGAHTFEMARKDARKVLTAAARDRSHPFYQTVGQHHKFLFHGV